MIAAGIFLYLTCGSAIASAAIYGVESFAGEEWWSSSFFVKFYSPSGKNYFIDYGTGEICKHSMILSGIEILFVLNERLYSSSRKFGIDAREWFKRCDLTVHKFCVIEFKSF